MKGDMKRLVQELLSVRYHWSWAVLLASSLVKKNGLVAHTRWAADSPIAGAWGLPPAFTLVSLGKRLAKHIAKG